MCGIIGYVGGGKAAPVVLEGLRTLEYRGYDSCGIATIDKELEIRKDRGMIGEVDRELSFREMKGSLGIGHTRWATHGVPSRENSHPHQDCAGEIALVHNGIISNYLELKEGLLERGHRFTSETDSEVLAHLIEEKHRSAGLEEAVTEALKEVKGSYAILVISKKEPGRILCARHESPLLLGIGEEGNFIGSDISAFLRHTKKVVPLEDMEYAVVEKEGWTVKNTLTREPVEKEVLTVDWDQQMAEKEGYPTFMEKEIHEQPRTVKNAMAVYDRDIKGLAEMIREAKRTYIIGAGTSLNAAWVSFYWFARLCKAPVIVMDSSEFIEGGICDEDTLVIGITQSGETYDTLAAMRHAREKGAKTAAIVNVIGSTATRESDHVVMQNSGIEIAVCATKTFTSQLVILLRTALELAKLTGEGGGETGAVEKELAHVPRYMEEVLEKEEEIKRVAEKYCNKRNYLYIGKGISLPTALEGALKFKEITYFHAEGMSSGLLKHGTISLIDDDMITVAIIPGDGENRERITGNVQEIKARGGFVIAVVSGEPVPQCDINITAPKCHELISPFVLTPICQLLAYHTARHHGRNVDRPRALAKSVTVG
ncbi:MAG: glutamine--fructose-6-phosphate transaminase (isomerizing) [Methanobacteriota archaeon]|nr:MAG: glutamine--fructose-6-phosphate transaminase (isomerizing) [Euryarchaeota archaeon]